MPKRQGVSKRTNRNANRILSQSFKLLVGQLRPQDKVAIVVYAGSAGLTLPATSGDKKSEILASDGDFNVGASSDAAMAAHACLDKISYTLAHHHQ